MNNASPITFKQLRVFIKEDWIRNDRSLFRPGFQALLNYRIACWRRGIKYKIIKAPLYLLYVIAHVFIRNFYGIEIFDYTRIGRRLRIAHQGGILVHNRSVIGDDCLIRQGVSIGRGPNHGGGVNNAAPVLGNSVEVGANAVLAGNITIGDNVTIGPCAVVMTNVPSNSIVASPICKVLPKLGS